jgi:hypothetical protein
LTEKATTGSGQDVTRRKVFYIPGYDPMLPRRYRELYRSEGAKQAVISGYDLALAARQGGENYGWRVTTEIGGARTEAEIEVLVWSDIVQASMDRSIPGTYLLLARVVWIYIASGALGRLMRLRKGPVIAALYPVAMLGLQALLAILLATGVGAGFALILPAWVGAAIGLVCFGWLLTVFRRIDNKLFAYYLLHDYAFSAVHRGDHTPELDDRMRAFGDRIAEALSDDVDEVLVVGHSSGAHIGVMVLAALLRDRMLPLDGPRLAFLSLGHVVPMVSFLPRANMLRRDLHFLSKQGGLTWIDVTAPGDGCTFALCDPVAVSGAAPAEGQIWPLVISAAFRQSLAPETFRALKWRFFRLHFQYLCAFDRVRDYDYFQITAGPLSLAARYAGRVPSPSRITRALSPYTDRNVA